MLKWNDIKETTVNEQLAFFCDQKMDDSVMSEVLAPTKTVVFEHPLTDPIRICLRLEHLYQQFQDSLKIQNKMGSRIAMLSLLKTINVIDRPDIRTKLVQTLSQHASTLAQLEQFDQVDTERLRSLLDELDFLITMLHQNHGKIAEKLRQNDFLNQVRLQLNNPAGATNYRNPAYAAWLAKPIKKQHDDLMTWSDELNYIYKIAEIILKITRHSTSFQKMQACDGFFQQSLDPSLPIQLLQIAISTDLNCYPEISVGRHRLNIRFLIPDYIDTGRAFQLHDTFIFHLNCCR